MKNLILKIIGLGAIFINLSSSGSFTIADKTPPMQCGPYCSSQKTFTFLYTDKSAPYGQIGPILPLAGTPVSFVLDGTKTIQQFTVTFYYYGSPRPYAIFPSNCNVQNGKNYDLLWNGLSYYCKEAAPSCPANSTLVGGVCKCNAGYAGDGKTCTKCETGQYAAAGATSCSVCPAGSSVAADQSSCTKCPKGQYAAAGATSCKACPAGSSISADQSSCTKCPTGQYAAAGATSCSVCPAGSSVAADQSSCTKCETGQYAAVGATSCTVCPAGSSVAADQSSCTKCPSGQYAAAGATSCTVCPAGSSIAADQSSCTQCPTNSISLAGATSCTKCDVNASVQDNKCVCKSGYLGDGLACELITACLGDFQQLSSTLAQMQKDIIAIRGSGVLNSSINSMMDVVKQNGSYWKHCLSGSCCNAASTGGTQCSVDVQGLADTYLTSMKKSYVGLTGGRTPLAPADRSKIDNYINQLSNLLDKARKDCNCSESRECTK